MNLTHLQGGPPNSGQSVGGARGLRKLLHSLAWAVDKMMGDGSIQVTWQGGRPIIGVAGNVLSGGGGGGGIPDGYEERAVKLYCGGEILDCTVLVKSNTETETENLVSTAYASTQVRKLLQVKSTGSAYVLDIDYGRAVD